MLTLGELRAQKMGKSAIQSIFDKIDAAICRDLPFWPYSIIAEIKVPDMINPKDVLEMVQGRYIDTLDINTGTDPHCLYVRYNERARNERLEKVKLDVENIIRRLEKDQLEYLDNSSRKSYSFQCNFDHRAIRALKDAVEKFGFVVEIGNPNYDSWLITEPKENEA